MNEKSNVALSGRHPIADDSSGEPYKRGDVVLVPQPSDDPRDPLNWPSWKKLMIYSIMCYATFTGLSAATANILAIVVQAKTFHVTPTTSALTVSAAIAGLIVGPLLLVPLVRVIGVTSCTFWSLVAVVGISIWSAEANGPEDFTSNAVSRGVAGLFCGTAQILTSGVIINLFFLHERGKYFAIHASTYTIATIAGPTFSGFIVQYVDWPVCFWWNVGANGLAAILVGLFVEDTAWDRQRDAPAARNDIPSSWVGNRVATLLPGTAVVPPIRVGEILKSSVSLFVIAFSPVTIMSGLYTLINFSWFVMITIELPIMLQMPYAPAKHLEGYGFTPQQNAAFFFANWISSILAVLYGSLLNDKIPLMVSRKRGGWAPEHRLYTAWFPGLLIGPIGLGIFGAAARYHLHYMVLALGTFLIGFAAVASVPVSINYVVECFRHYPQEVGAVLNVYRLGFALSIPFWYDLWEEAVGVGWVYGMAAFFSVLGFLLLVLLMWQGHTVRRFNLWKDDTDGEEGAKIN